MGKWWWRWWPQLRTDTDEGAAAIVLASVDQSEAARVDAVATQRLGCIADQMMCATLVRVVTRSGKPPTSDSNRVMASTNHCEN